MPDWQGFVSLVPPPPWYYSGDLLTIEYRTDPGKVAALLPDPLELAGEDPGAVAAIWADWQSCSGSFEELLDPVRSQYKECFYVVRCRYRGETYSRCVDIWVDKDFSLVRGYHQGYPKKLGEIWMTRPVTVGRAGPRLEPGGRFGASLSAGGRRILDAELILTGPSETGGFVNAHAMLHHRILPAIESDGPNALHEIVTMRGEDVDLGPAYRGEAELHQHHPFLEPKEILAGYWRSVGVTWKGGTTLERHHG
ncbi:MAG TPA: acetoacetate decarboxylase family protein [Vicinamibacteria bacterium]|nr:acetoacetate decarboxylase family protein [Vicinamibacteria bacterium]